jgi:hypothetical protein
MPLEALFGDGQDFMNPVSVQRTAPPCERIWILLELRYFNAAAVVSRSTLTRTAKSAMVKSALSAIAGGTRPSPLRAASKSGLP